MGKTLSTLFTVQCDSCNSTGYSQNNSSQNVACRLCKGEGNLSVYRVVPSFFWSSELSKPRYDIDNWENNCNSIKI